MNKEEAWKKFQESGKVEDYLKYKQAEQVITTLGLIFTI